MGNKVTKFGGTSVADAIQLSKIKEIIESDEERKYVIVSAPGKRFDGDSKVTDLLYLCKTHIEHNVPHEQILQVIMDRFLALKVSLGVEVDLNEQFALIKENLLEGASADYMASRGEYLNAMLIAAYLGYDFIDMQGVIKFNERGALLVDETNSTLKEVLSKHEKAVIPGF